MDKNLFFILLHVNMSALSETQHENQKSVILQKAQHNFPEPYTYPTHKYSPIDDYEANKQQLSSEPIY